ncbi:phosphotransferase [Olsenella uli]|uniref:phosphotransferase n=1 Tax=Olsenella uli TaxID=133926 RepID=UPI001956CA60|nr:phosphotransferase [Olsenella uli]MBM6676708.1 phosphotransferase [Olsenella uli]
MSLTRDEFEVLRALSSTGSPSGPDDLAGLADLTGNAAQSAIRSCKQAGLVEDGRITERGIEALEPHRVRNAVILAAGLSSRLVPLSYERPKGMLRVRGEVLIERQIEQLLRRGISDITVAVGYKKEYFFYLTAKYGVKIVVNDQYAERNNSWTLWLLREGLGNTYVCSSDDYFTVNPFERYVWKSYYAAEYVDGKTSEWCLSACEDGRITGVTVGGSDSWVMLGHAYLDRAFCERFVPMLDEEIRRAGSEDELWESVLVRNVGSLDMEVRRYPKGVIHEFDSLAEVEGFDPEFIDNVDSRIFDNIMGVLGCSREEIRDIYPLKQGLTNLSCHFATDSGEWVYRHPGVGTELLIDRSGEVAALETARRLGIDDTFVFEDSKRGWKISRFVPNSRQPDPHDPDQLARMMRMGRELHESDVSVARHFDFYEEAKRYEGLILEKGPINIPGYAEMSAKVDRLEAHVRADNARVCLCHNDFFYMNFLIDEDEKYYLIDWEYAGMSDYANDYGTCVVCCELTEAEALRALGEYLGHAPEPEEVRHCLAHVQLAGWCWYLWSLLKEAEGDFVGEWLYIYFRYADEYLDKTLALYEGEKPLGYTHGADVTS